MSHEATNECETQIHTFRKQRYYVMLSNFACVSHLRNVVAVLKESMVSDAPQSSLLIGTNDAIYACKQR